MNKSIEALSEMDAGAAPSPSPRVVLLDDHSIVRESLARSLELAGIPVVAQFSNPEEFLAALSGLEVDVAIVNLLLEGPGSGLGLDGLSILRAIRRSRSDVRTLVLSAVRTPNAYAEAFRVGAAAYLCKLDATSERLVAAVRAVAGGAQLLEPDQTGLSSLGEPRSPLRVGLTAREEQVLACLATGADNLKIAALLNITERTVRAHVSSLYRKLQRENRTELALDARELGLLSPQALHRTPVTT